MAAPSDAWLPSPPRTSACARHRVRIQDFWQGGRGESFTAGEFSIVAYQELSSSVKFSGTWSNVARSTASGLKARTTTKNGAAATFAFTGNAVAWVGSTGPTYGSARVYVDERLAATINQYAKTTSPRRVLWATSWLASGKHTVKVVALGTAGHPLVEIDAFLLMR